MTKTIPCPTCAKKVKWEPQSKYRPFCCERCKLIDFGSWAKEEHKIPGDPAFDDRMSEEETRH